MKTLYLKQKRLNKLIIPQETTLDSIEIGIPVTGGEATKVGIKQEGQAVLPSANFGPQSRRNAYGYSYADKSKKKRRRYVSTNWIHPFGNKNADEIPVDIYRKCYPKVEVEPYGIEIQLISNDKNELFLIALLDEQTRKNNLKEAINLFLEIYGECYIFDEKIEIGEIEKLNWEILPEGESPSNHMRKYVRGKNKNESKFSFHRLQVIQQYHFKKEAVGTKGFAGYYAFVSSNCCVLESAMYGNATYIIPGEDWKKLSQKSKRELFDGDKVLCRIVHNKGWAHNIESEFDNLGIKKQKQG